MSVRRTSHWCKNFVSPKRPFAKRRVTKRQATKRQAMKRGRVDDHGGQDPDDSQLASPRGCSQCRYDHVQRRVGAIAGLRLCGLRVWFDCTAGSDYGARLLCGNRTSALPTERQTDDRKRLVSRDHRVAVWIGAAARPVIVDGRSRGHPGDQPREVSVRWPGLQSIQPGVGRPRLFAGIVSGCDEKLDSIWWPVRFVAVFNPGPAADDAALRWGLRRDTVI